MSTKVNGYGCSMTYGSETKSPLERIHARTATISTTQAEQWHMPAHLDFWRVCALNVGQWTVVELLLQCFGKQDR